MITADDAVLCLDIGSTWTKAALVTASGELRGTGQHPTTVPEVLHGVHVLARRLDVDTMTACACSSAGGGLRLAVVGQERLISAEAAHRVALSAGAKVVHRVAGELDDAALADLRANRPDLLLLAGGTDGGDEAVLGRNIAALRDSGDPHCPIVFAGNDRLRARATSELGTAGWPVSSTGNVLPDIGVLDPAPARAAIREAFLAHVIGGKELSADPRLRDVLVGVTPEAVLRGVAEYVASAGEPAPRGSASEAGGVLVVDVGGATTDVYSAVPEDAEAAPVSDRAVGLPVNRRTVEGDLGMRWSAPGVVTEACVEGLLDEADSGPARRAAQHRHEYVDHVPADAREEEFDLLLARWAATVALRRHLRHVEGRMGPSGAAQLVLSGGVFRHAATGASQRVADTLAEDPMLRPVLRRAAITVDERCVLAPAGLLIADGRRDAALRLLRDELT